MANESPDGTAPLSELEKHFGDNVDVAQRIIDLIEATPDRVWRAAELFSECEIVSRVEGYMLIARLTTIGAISHPDLGLYSSVGSAAESRTA